MKSKCWAPESIPCAPHYGYLIYSRSQSSWLNNNQSLLLCWEEMKSIIFKIFPCLFPLTCYILRKKALVKNIPTVMNRKYYKPNRGQDGIIRLLLFSVCEVKDDSWTFFLHLPMFYIYIWLQCLLEIQLDFSRSFWLGKTRSKCSWNTVQENALCFTPVSSVLYEEILC